MNTFGQTTAATHALYRHRPPTHAEQRAQLIDQLDQDDQDNEEVAA